MFPLTQILKFAVKIIKIEICLQNKPIFLFQNFQVSSDWSRMNFEASSLECSENENTSNF